MARASPSWTFCLIRAQAPPPEAMYSSRAHTNSSPSVRPPTEGDNKIWPLTFHWIAVDFETKDPDHRVELLAFFLDGGRSRHGARMRQVTVTMLHMGLILVEIGPILRALSI